LNEQLRGLIATARLLRRNGPQDIRTVEHIARYYGCPLDGWGETQVLIFGNPKGGTPLMLAAPSVAIDLPLKLLVREDATGAVWVNYWSAQALKRHGLAESLAQNISVIDIISRQAMEETGN
jgi:hypothetical protein